MVGGLKRPNATVSVPLVFSTGGGPSCAGACCAAGCSGAGAEVVCDKFFSLSVCGGSC